MRKTNVSMFFFNKLSNLSCFSNSLNFYNSIFTLNNSTVIVLTPKRSRLTPRLSGGVASSPPPAP